MSIEIDLSNQLAVVTGGAGGIGAGIAQTLVEAGARVLLVDRDEAGLKTIAATLTRSTICVQADIADHSELERSLLPVLQELGPARILVNNAGVASRVGMPFTRLEPADWQLPWSVNVIGLFNVTKLAVKGMQEAQRGVIINIASVSGRVGFPTSPPYSASKAAVINFTQVMARDLASWGIRVNAVCPGMVFTPFYRAQRLAAAEADPTLLGVSDEDYFENKARRLIPLQRGQTPKDIAHAVCFLASDLAASITGQALNVDGGLVMS